MSENVKPVQRIQGNLLARAERRLLTWLCGRLPAWVKPDQLTSLGLVGAAMVMVGYAASGDDRNWLWLAIAGFFVALLVLGVGIPALVIAVVDNRDDIPEANVSNLTAEEKRELTTIR